MLAKQRLLRAARRILRPLVRIMLRNGIASDAFTELVRTVYVEVADQEFSLPGKKQTVSRISVITGLNRKEVARLRGSDPLDSSDERWRNRAAAVLGAWERDPTFTDHKADPMDLPFADDGHIFSALVKKHSGDMQPRAVADELLRLGAIEAVDGKLRMRRHGYEPGSDPEALLDMLGTDVGEFIETVDHNVQAEEDDTLLQAKVRYDRVPAEHAEEFLALSRRLSRNLINELNHWLGARDRGTETVDPAAHRTLGLGIYQIQAPSAPDSSNTEEPVPQEHSHDS